MIHHVHNDDAFYAGIGGAFAFIYNMLTSGQLWEAFIMGGIGTLGGIIMREMYKFAIKKYKAWRTDTTKSEKTPTTEK